MIMSFVCLFRAVKGMSTVTVVFVALICVAVIVALVVFWRTAHHHEQNYKASVAEAIRNRPTLLSIKHAGGGSYHAAIAASATAGSSSSAGPTLGPKAMLSRGSRRISYSNALNTVAERHGQGQGHGGGRGSFPRHSAWDDTPDTSLQLQYNHAAAHSAGVGDTTAGGSRANRSVLNVSVRNRDRSGVGGGGGAVLGFNAPEGVAVPRVVAVRDSELLGAARTRLDHTLNAAFNVLKTVGEDDDVGGGGGERRARTERAPGAGKTMSSVGAGGGWEGGGESATDHEVNLVSDLSPPAAAPVQAPWRQRGNITLATSTDEHDLGSESLVDTDAMLSGDEGDGAANSASRRHSEMVDADTALVLDYPHDEVGQIQPNF